MNTSTKLIKIGACYIRASEVRLIRKLDALDSRKPRFAVDFGWSEFSNGTHTIDCESVESRDALADSLAHGINAAESTCIMGIPGVKLCADK